jgi:carbon-monoxide dehydrogenase medium subunit
MLENLKEVYRPGSLEEAIRILKKGKGKIIPLAGCTTLGLVSRPAVSGGVDMEGLGLSYVKEERGTLKIGAGTTISKLLTYRSIQSVAGGLLYQAAAAIGSTLNRNMITVGGNIVQVYSWSHLPVVLLALGAKIRIRGKATRLVNARRFFLERARYPLGYDELVTEVVIPRLSPATKGRFLKFSRTQTDYGLVNIAVLLKKHKGILVQAAIVLGALSPFPQKMEPVEKKLKGKKLTGSLIMQAAKEAAGEVAIGKDIRTTKEYKRELVEVLVERALKGAGE